MKDVKYVPKCFSDEGSTFEGHVVVAKPSVIQRFNYINECNFEVNADGSVDISLKKIAPMLKALELSLPHYKEISIKKKDGSEKYDNIEDLTHSSDPEIEKMLFEIAGLILSGFKPEKNLSPL